jgi:long-chain acyl-CoA synthetase
MMKDTLYQIAHANNNLLYIDLATRKSYGIEDLPQLVLKHHKKSVVFAYLDNSIKSIGIFWAVMKSQHTLALLPPNMSIDLKEQLEKIYNPNFIFDFTREEIPYYDLEKENNIRFFKRTYPYDYEINSKIKLLLSTSGSTGSPKFVKLSERNMISNAFSIASYLPITSTDITPLNLPIHYSYGLSVLTSNSINGGIIICGNEDVLQKTFWENLQIYGYTSLAGVPFIYEMLDRIGFTKNKYSSIKYLTQAGGKLKDGLAKKYAKYCNESGISFFVMYGQTEATARMSYLEPEYVLDKTGSIGKAIPGGKFSIDSNSGELLYQGENVFGGYVDQPKDLTYFVQPEKLCTGDLAVVDSEGFYYITGRLKRFVKLFGIRINLDEVETLVDKVMGQTVKCIGINDKLLVVLFDNINMPIDSVIKFISEELKLHLSVIRKQWVAEFPLTHNGKVNYKALTEEYGAI